MYSTLLSPLPLARWYIEQVAGEGDAVLDCTAGNGQDTAFLAGLVGRTGTVFAFDTQEQAITATMKRIQEYGFSERVHIIQDSHIRVGKYISQPIRAAMFNLGYLPGGDHTITTTAEDSVAALGMVLELLAPGGIVTIIVYPGHPEGMREKEMLNEFVSSLNKEVYAVMHGDFQKKTSNPPGLIVIQSAAAEKYKSGVQK